MGFNAAKWKAANPNGAVEPPSGSLNQVFSDARKDCLRRLEDLFSEAFKERKTAEALELRERAQRIREEIDVIDRLHGEIIALAQNNHPEPVKSSESSVDHTRYAHHKRAVEATRAFLQKIDRPATEDEIIHELRDGGFRGDVDGTSLVIEKSLRSYTFGTGLKSKLIKKIGELWGLGEWDDSRFK